jgi:serine/threonine protein kinase/Flp pilus assembly protein TadD
MIGREISHYRILEQLGGGGMGVVYKALDLRLDRFVALKFLPPELTLDEEAKQRFIQEAHAASSLQHPNICVIFDVDETAEGQLFISMEYLDGETLKKRIARSPLPADEAASIGGQIARGLAKAHEHGIVHRDIKPANIMVTTDGVAKIVDFGLAKLAGQSTMTVSGTTLGTFAYMSPEQARGEPVDSRTDLWSLGVVLYEACTGVRPFRSDYQQAVIYSILNEKPRPPREILPSIPEPLEAILLHALAKDPAARYQNAADFAQDLHDMQPPTAAGAPPRRKTGARRFVTPRLVALSSLILLGAVLTVVFVVPSSAVPFNSRDWIVVADFENTTGEEVFDKALNTAFNISIAQSNHVNIMPRSRMGDVLRRMRKADGKSIDETTAREIALREELSLVVVPGISKVGSQYALTWKIEDAKDGATLQSGMSQARQSEDILPSLDDITHDIRRALGESRLSISQRGMRLTRVTTKSLDALKAYSLGVESHYQANFQQARFQYAAALALDTGFTAARASLGMLCYERFDTTEGKQILSAVLKNLDALTDKERFGVLAFHSRAVLGNPDLAAKYWSSLLSTYPDYGIAHNNLGYLYYGQENFEEAAREYREAIRCDPSLYLTYFNLEWLYLYRTGEVDSALALCRRHVERAPEHGFAYDNLGYACIGKDSLAEALAAFQKLIELNPKYPTGLYRLSDTYRMLGRFREAMAPLQQIFRLDTTDVYAHYQLGILCQLMNDRAASERYFRLFLAEQDILTGGRPKKGTELIDRGKVLVRVGETERGSSLGRQGIELDSAAHFEYAQFLTVLHRHQEALDQLERAVDTGFSNFIWIKLQPDLWELRNEPRFHHLMKRVLKG